MHDLITQSHVVQNSSLKKCPGVEVALVPCHSGSCTRHAQQACWENMAGGRSPNDPRATPSVESQGNLRVKLLQNDVLTST